MNSNYSLMPLEAKWQQMKRVVASWPVDESLNLVNYKKLVLFRFIAENCLLFFLQYIGLMIIGAINPLTIAPIWLNVGTASSFIFMRGYRVLPGIFLGSLLGYLSANHLICAAFNAAIDTCQAFCLWWISYQIIGNPTLIFYQKKKLLYFIFYSGVLTALASLFHGLSYYSLLSQTSLLISIWIVWWLGNLGGIFLFAFAIVALDFYFSTFDTFVQTNKFKLFISYGLLFILNLLLLMNPMPALILFTIPIVTYIIFSWHWRGLVAALFMIGLMLDFGAYFGMLLYQSMTITHLIFIQLTLLLEAIIGFLLAVDKQNEAFAVSVSYRSPACRSSS